MARPIMSETEGPAIWQLLNGELKSQFIGWISGESIGYVWDHAHEPEHHSSMSRKELLEAHRGFYDDGDLLASGPRCFKRRPERCGTN